jgi:hypothetical protein
LNRPIALTFLPIDRDLIDSRGDVLARPYPNCYWLVPGQLLAGEHPGAVMAALVSPRVDALLDAGIRQFIDLTEEGEPPAPYAAILRERALARAIRASYRRFPIRDMGVPSAAGMRIMLDGIHAALAAGDPVYVHCWAGVGRTGTVAGCFLREHGLSAGEALGVIAASGSRCKSASGTPRHPSGPSSSRSSKGGPGHGQNRERLSKSDRSMATCTPHGRHTAACR